MTVARTRLWARRRAERIVYRIGGLPVAIGALLASNLESPAASLRSSYATYFWNPEDLSDLVELLLATVIWPAGLLAAAGWFLWKNGEIIRQRCGKGRARQFGEQIRAYFSAGILPPWYYMFELHDDRCDAKAFINRSETKRGIYPLLKEGNRAASPLSDKAAFAERCRAHQLRTVPILAVATNGRVELLDREHLPEIDLFVKPIEGRGGRGAERWDHVHGGYQGPGTGYLAEVEFLAWLRERSLWRPMLVQPRIRNSAELADLNNGALSTIRIVTCLDERGRPEVAAAAMRMATGDNHRVDNFHAGGIAAAVDLETGALGPASDLGMDARLGWVDAHPDSGARIRGRLVPCWKEACGLAERAHRAFDDRVIIGWDIAPAEDGPMIVEGNGSPDLDIVQRTARLGLTDSRLCRLLAHHLAVADQAAVSIPSSPSLR